MLDLKNTRAERDEKNASHAADLYVEFINETFVPLCINSGIVPTTKFFRKSLYDIQLKETKVIVWKALIKTHIGECYFSDIPVYEIYIEWYNTLIRFSKTIEKLRVYALGLNTRFHTFDGSDVIPSVDSIYIKSGKAILKNSTQSDIRPLLTPFAMTEVKTITF